MGSILFHLRFAAKTSRRVFRSRACRRCSRKTARAKVALANPGRAELAIRHGQIRSKSPVNLARREKWFRSRREPGKISSQDCARGQSRRQEPPPKPAE